LAFAKCARAKTLSDGPDPYRPERMRAPISSLARKEAVS
jgi:hypothetical protein